MGIQHTPSKHAQPVLSAMFTVLLTSGNAGAQIPAAETERFEVSSIKRSATSSVGGGFDAPPGRFIAQNTTPLQLIAMAYRIDALRVVGPDWMSRERFDVVATTPVAWQPARAATMVRQLLADRFGLIVHRESRELPAFVLTRVRDGTTGPNLRQTTRDCSPPPSSSFCSTRTLPGSVVVSGARWPNGALVNVLQGEVGRTVVDRTGLSGQFDFTLEWEPMTQAAPPGAPVATRPLLFTALREQLGLALTSSRERLEVVVVDRIEPPTPD